MTGLAVLLFLTGLTTLNGEPQDIDTLRVGVVGLVHGHVGWILGREDRGDIDIVGIAESDRDLAQRYAARYGFDTRLVYETAQEMLEATEPEAVTVFSNTYDHLAVTEAAAAQGVHVMVEKPMAISLEHARRMKAVADSAGIHLLTNYETTWYPTVHYAKDQIATMGDIRKIIVYDGHPGPVEIGVGEEFWSWLLTEEKNGGGALMDFGCYGANLITWFMEGQRPVSVIAVTQIYKAEAPYGAVDDEATIILAYPSAQGIIQASWNWPFNRKDMHVYATGGYVFQDDGVSGRIRRTSGADETFRLEPRGAPYDDPFAYLAAVVRGEVDPEGSPSSLEINMVAMEILDAARRSVRSGQKIVLDP